MNILITGASGYLGGRITQYLSGLQNNQIVFGSSRIIKNDNLPLYYKSVQTIWNSPKELKSICSGIDVIIHLAGMNSIDSSADPKRAFEFNRVATGNLLNAAITSGVKRFIFFSTAHVYSNNLKGIITEKTFPNSTHPYSLSHLAGEEIVLNANKENKIEGIVLRLSNSYGPPFNKQANCWMLLVNDLCKQIVTKGQMKLTSSGLNRRDFITINDVCRVVEHLIKLKLNLKNENIFNVGGDWSPTVWEMACYIQKISNKMLNYKPKLTRINPSESEKVDDLDYSISKLKETGFKLNNNRELEIINLINFCNFNFSMNK